MIVKIIKWKKIKKNIIIIMKEIIINEKNILFVLFFKKK